MVIILNCYVQKFPSEVTLAHMDEHKTPNILACHRGCMIFDKEYPWHLLLLVDYKILVSDTFGNGCQRQHIELWGGKVIGIKFKTHFSNKNTLIMRIPNTDISLI